MLLGTDAASQASPCIKQMLQPLMCVSCLLIRSMSWITLNPKPARGVRMEGSKVSSDQDLGPGVGA